MKKFQLIALASLVLSLAALWVTRSRGTAHAAAVPQMGSTCVSYVPREWGQYKGGSAQSGLAFEDSAGTLRFVTNLPCGAAPVVALEVRRPLSKANSDNN